MLRMGEGVKVLDGGSLDRCVDRVKVLVDW